MNRIALLALTFATLGLGGCSVFRSSGGDGAPSPSEGAQNAAARRAPAGGDGGPGVYAEVVTDEAETREGLFRTHRIDDKLLFEIPVGAFDTEMLLIGRPVESTLQDPGGFFGGGARLIVQWERHGDAVVLREKEYDIVADSADAIWGQVGGFRNGPVLARFDIEAYNPTDSAAVVEVTDLFLTYQRELGAVQGTRRDASWFEHVAAFPRNIEVEATQTGSDRSPGAPSSAPNTAQTVRMHWSMLQLPDEPMMPRWEDDRVGYISSQWYDFSVPEHQSRLRSFIHRHRLEPSDPVAFARGELVDPVEPIVYWIDPATPDWLKPWVKKGVDEWAPAFEEAGFRNAIRGEIAPADDPDWSMFDARHSVIYWRPSTVPNATGGQTVDPRSGEILKGEVNMYHNVMNLLRNWYFIQVSPLDERAQQFPLPDSLMGRMVEYVVTHEIGHAIGFPHNMKASAMYPADSIRSVDFLERMGGHVATLMDYSRFNYVAQPEDSIPVDLLVPKVGPYDRFAVKWGYRPIPEASTPDEELPVLDAWARTQDTIPWLRFSTSDAPNDPENQTEAVGDADAVKSTTLALLNLERVMNSLIDVAERPGEDYALLEELYGEGVGQWGRYMRHVAALIGGAITQEKYGTGARFEPVAEERQREAMTFLAENAFDVPEMFLDRDVLWRIEAEGAVARIRQAQSGILNTLLSPRKLNTLVEYEALTDGDTYTLPEFMADLRRGVWGPLSGSGTLRMDIHRRNLQRAWLDAVDAELNPSDADLERESNAPAAARRAPRWASDVRALLREELRELDTLAGRAESRAGDALTRVHLRDVQAEIDRILSGGE
ncbi:zinc-dependent metalloprotease [Gemmatimonadota bacterium Y43]|uniref:zinc-dependent metalloprotease n=1 Tax=Gaopeijia maritima TaxID=3119007 RepID=UPI00328ED909